MKGLLNPSFDPLLRKLSKVQISFFLCHLILHFVGGLLRPPWYCAIVSPWYIPWDLVLYIESSFTIFETFILISRTEYMFPHTLIEVKKHQTPQGNPSNMTMFQGELGSDGCLVMFVHYSLLTLSRWLNFKVLHSPSRVVRIMKRTHQTKTIAQVIPRLAWAVEGPWKFYYS